MAWSPEHEARVRGMITTAVQVYVDTPGVVVPGTPSTPTTPNTPSPGIK